MLRNLRRKIYHKIRFKTWYRKGNYWYRKHAELDDIIRAFRPAEVFEDKKYIRALKRDMVRSLYKHGSYFNEYFLFNFEGKDDDYRSTYITEGIRMSYYPRMNSPKNTNMLENKYSTYKKFPEMFKRDMMQIRVHSEISPEGLEQFREFTDKHPRYVVKPTYASMGHGFRIEELSDYESVEAAYECYHEEGVVLEEIIIQDPRMAEFHPQSVNTLRIPTALIHDDEGNEQIYLYNPTLRVGQHGSVIDNTSAGGISVMIDKETGCLSTDGADKKGNRYISHPDTGVVFKGHPIPEWDKAVAMVSEAARQVPGNHYCGWDLAMFDGRGWCMVEANCNAQMSGMQFVPQIGRKPELEALIAKM